jgi:predicted regulator of Ras-like GTPase activity (Roadblock/LC7/MglB family)
LYTDNNADESTADACVKAESADDDYQQYCADYYAEHSTDSLPVKADSFDGSQQQQQYCADFHAAHSTDSQHVKAESFDDDQQQQLCISCNSTYCICYLNGHSHDGGIKSDADDDDSVTSATHSSATGSAQAVKVEGKHQQVSQLVSYTILYCTV